jgi:hypothetical protein
MSPGCSGNKTAGKSNTYTPKKMGGQGTASKGSYTPRTARATMSTFGKPAVRMSFSGKR